MLSPQTAQLPRLPPGFRCYLYRDEQGTPAHATIRGPGNFTTRIHWTSEGWIRGLDRGSSHLYNLPQIAGTPRDAPIYLTGNEPDAEVLIARGLPATTPPLGDGCWHERYQRWLRRRPVIILATDEPGQTGASKRADALEGVAASVKIIRFPELNRSNIESTHSMTKGKFAGAARSNSDTDQINEVLCKVLHHNFCVVIQSIHEVGIEPMFGLARQTA